jgi:pimeloyl-ACP methyl ester carboxylesterase
MEVTVHGVSFAVEQAGEGEPVLLVHGFPLDHRMWQAQVAEFSATHRVVAPDLRGLGDSWGAAEVVTMDQYADDLAGLLDALGIREPVTLCGLSMGGYIAFAFVRRHRDRLARLILCDTKAAADPPGKKADREKTAGQVLAEGTVRLVENMPKSLLAGATFETQPAVVAAVREMIASAPPAGVAAASRGMAARPDSTDLLPRIDVPTLVLCGEQDAITPPAEMRAMAERIPGAMFDLISDAGHMSPMENSAAVNAAIRRLLGD